MTCDLSHISRHIFFYRRQFSSKPGWRVLSGRSINVPDTATRAGLHNGNAGRVADPPHASDVGEDVPERTTRMHTPCRETNMAKNADRAGIFGDSLVDLNVTASRRRNGAERTDPPTPGGFRRGGGTPPAKKPLEKTVRGGRDPPTKNESDQAEDRHRS